MPNAYDDLLQPQGADTAAPKANAYADLIPTETGEQKKPAVETPSIGSQLGRGAGLTGRALIQGVTGLPGMVADAGHSVYELATDPDARAATWEQMKHPSQWLNMPQNAPSQQFSHALDPYLPQPQTVPEKVMSAGLGAEAGALGPQVPTPGATAPEGFMGTAQVAQALRSAKIKAAQDAGFVVPPSTTNPTAWNKMREAFGGKIAVQQGAQAANEQARSALVAKDLGLDPDLLTPTSVAAVKREAGSAIDGARSIPLVKTDDQYLNDLAAVEQKTIGANESFPGSANPDVSKIVSTYTQPEFTGSAGVSAIKNLRDKARDAYSQGNSEAGMAYKGVSQAIESQLERGAPPGYEPLAQGLMAARKRYAQASTIEDVMDPMGSISGPKLAAAWNRGEPLSGGTRQAAEFAASFPKANLPANSSPVSHLSTAYHSIGLSEALGALAMGEPKAAVAGAAIAAVPAARRLTANYLLGPGQGAAIPAGASKAATLAKALSKPTVMAGAYDQNR